MIGPVRGERIRVLGVHGIGNYRWYRDAGESAWQAAAAFGREWETWLAAGLPDATGADVAVAYYAHHLHRGTPQGVEDDPDTLEPAAQDMLVAWVELLQPAPQIALGPRTARARQAADWLTRHAGPTARAFALAFCREVTTYLGHPGSPRRAAARRAVADAIARHRPHAIVAHSLGSVVAYEALWAYPALHADLLLTVGSPLAMPAVVFDQLQPPASGGRGSRPPGIARWVNLADPGDLVAIPRGGLGPHFTGVDHDGEVTIGKWDFHTARGYLRCQDVGRTLLAWP